MKEEEKEQPKEQAPQGQTQLEQAPPGCKTVIPIPDYEEGVYFDPSFFNIDYMKPFVDVTTVEIISKTYNIDNVNFEKLEDFIAICKRMEHTIFDTDILPYLQVEETKIRARELWETMEPISAKEALAFTNSEQRMLALKYVGFEALVSELKAELLSEEKIHKKQKRLVLKNDHDKSGMFESSNMEELFDEIDVEFDDVYRLYKIPRDLVGLEDEDYFGVECDCPSTGRKYFNTVPPHEKAIDAVAWTLHVSRAEYLELETES